MQRHRQRAAARARGGATAREVNIPLPTKGLFVEAKTAELRGIFAGDLLNWRSTGASIKLRPPYSSVSTGKTTFGDIVMQRIPFEFGGESRYLTVTGETINDGTTFWLRNPDDFVQTAYISSTAVMVGGNGKPLVYNGEALTEATFTTTTGVDPEDFTGVVGHQDRLFFWTEGDDIDFYYGDVGAITGPLTRFPLGRLGNITGSIMCMKSLTIDAGNGMNDVLAIFTTTGQIIIYEGLDPGDANSWRQTARVKSSPPISQAAFLQVGADLWMLTANGIVSLLQSLNNPSAALVKSVTRPIQQELLRQLDEGGEWSLYLTADATAAIINRVYQGKASQFIYWTDTQSWDTADIPARWWHTIGIDSQFTEMDTGDLGTFGVADGEPITGRWTSSWFRLPGGGGITYVVPTIIAEGPLEVKVMILTDHDTSTPDIAEAAQTVTIYPDNEADPGGRVSLNEVIAVDAVGDVFQITIEVTALAAEIVSMKAAVL